MVLYMESHVIVYNKYNPTCTYMYMYTLYIHVHVYTMYAQEYSRFIIIENKTNNVSLCINKTVNSHLELILQEDKHKHDFTHEDAWRTARC